MSRLACDECYNEHKDDCWLNQMCKQLEAADALAKAAKKYRGFEMDATAWPTARKELQFYVDDAIAAYEKARGMK